MSKMLFVNFPVADLAKSTAFYEALGLTKNPQFSDDASACMVLSETIFVMLLTHAKWSTFTSRPVAPAATSEVMLALTCESRAAVDALANAAAAHGGVADVDLPQDLGFRSIAIWPTPMVIFGKRCGWTWRPTGLLPRSPRTNALKRRIVMGSVAGRRPQHDPWLFSQASGYLKPC